MKLHKNTRLIIIAFIIGAVIGTAVFKIEKSRLRGVYKVWCKQTGNPKELTFNEFWRLHKEGMLRVTK